MNFHPIHLRRGNAMTHVVAEDGSLTVVYGEGGGCTLNMHGGAQAILIPLCGSIQIAVSGFVNTLRTGEALVTEHDTSMKVVGFAKAQWVALLGGKQAWTHMLAGREVVSPAGTPLLPARHFANRDLRRVAVALARSATHLLEGSANAVVDNIVGLQSQLCDAISRCPGRNHAMRLSVFLRLQRVRNFVNSCCDQDLCNNVLARMANYAPSHFVRIFNQVFGETPHAYLVNARLHRARRLLHSSDLSVTEVAQASGFDNRSAFSRLFHQRFGTTANAMRRLARNAA